MTEAEYYELPLGVADRLELQHFLLADHYQGAARVEARKCNMEAQSTNELVAAWLFQLKTNTEERAE